MQQLLCCRFSSNYGFLFCPLLGISMRFRLLSVLEHWCDFVVLVYSTLPLSFASIQGSHIPIPVVIRRFLLLDLDFGLVFVSHSSAIIEGSTNKSLLCTCLSVEFLNCNLMHLQLAYIQCFWGDCLHC